MIGALLRRASEATHRELFNRLHSAGFDDLRWTHFALFVFPGMHGVRPTELAVRVGISKQALNALLNELDEFGYIIRQAAPQDGRHRVLELTPRGLELAAAMKRILEEIETTIGQRIGMRQLARVKAAAAEIAAMFPPPTT